MKFKEQDYQGEYNLKRAERKLILRALSVKPNKISAAKALGIDVRTLLNKQYQHSIK